MTQTDRQKMIDKIVGLLALADSTNHDEEADTARKMAGKLMAKYSIDFTDVKEGETVTFTQEDYCNINPQKYEVQLENAIGKFNGVLIITVTKWGGSKYIRLVGSRENIDAHMYMMDLVKSQRNNAWNIFRANQDFLDQPVTQKEKAKWFMGYSYGVNNKVWDLINASAEAKQEWGLVVIDPVKAAEEWYKESHSLVTRKNRASQFSTAGLNSGRNVNLNRAVTTSNRPTLMIGAN